MHITSYDMHYPASARVNYWQWKCMKLGGSCTASMARKNGPRQKGNGIPTLYTAEYTV